jgi:ABC-type transport system involved in Fe-S cluster assembly fused permease/ATPase subunit
VFAGLTTGAIAAYTAFTIGVTQWRTRFRQAMNGADAEAGKRAMDSLINYETVKLYGNEAHEQARYDACLAGARAAPLPFFDVMGARVAGFFRSNPCMTCMLWATFPD